MWTEPVLVQSQTTYHFRALQIRHENADQKWSQFEAMLETQAGHHGGTLDWDTDILDEPQYSDVINSMFPSNLRDVKADQKVARNMIKRD